MTTTDHKCWRMSGTPLNGDAWAFECHDCDHVEVSTLHERIHRIQQNAPAQVGPDGNLPAGLVAVFALLAMGASVVGLVTAAFMHSGPLAAASAAAGLTGALTMRWAWKSGVDR